MEWIAYSFKPPGIIAGPVQSNAGFQAVAQGSFIQWKESFNHRHTENGRFLRTGYWLGHFYDEDRESG